MVFSEGVSGREEENGFDQHEPGIDPADATWWLNGDSVADRGNGRGDKSVGVKLIMDVMNFDQQQIGIDLSGQL